MPSYVIFEGRKTRVRGKLGSCGGLEIVMEVSIFGSRYHRVFNVREELYMF